MQPIEITAFDLAQRFYGVREVAGVHSNALILGMLRLDQEWPASDAVPWCSSFTSFICWLLRLPRSKSLAARSWLEVGTPTPLSQAEVGFDVVVLKRSTGKPGANPEPGPEVLAAPGHVGFYAGREGEFVMVLGGNQGDAVNVSRYALSDILGIRRLRS